MRLCFSTLGCPDWDFAKILSAASLGFSAVEVRGIGPNLHPDEIECFLPENRERTKAALSESGLELAGFGSSVMLHRDEDLSEGFAAIEMCAAMGIPFVRVFGDAFPDGEARESVYRRVIHGLNGLLDAAAGKGVLVLLETHGQFNSLSALEPLIMGVHGNPAFGLVWDIEHTFRAHGKETGRVFERIRPYVKHVHVKDARHAPGGETEWALPGEGEIDIAEHVCLLEESGYSGYYSFEWEKRWRPDIPEPEEVFPMYVRYMQSIGGLL